ncbi:MAG: hypothetical protein K2Y23_27440 [Cyanobacteria bacterium]|nr:hypothetical protein [Cyanobacteriota bacterium]
MMRTFFTLRAALVLLSFSLPIGLLIYSFAKHGYLKAGSISEFYGHENGAMRDFFVAILCVVGALLVLYKGYGWLENWLLNAAGGFAVATAMIPCNCWEGGGAKNGWHGLVAIMFFVCVGATCLFCANQTVDMLPTEADRKWYSRAYYLVGVWLFIAPLSACGLAFALGQGSRWVFAAEFAAIAVFAIYWALKSREIAKTSSERKAIFGKLANVNGRVVERDTNVEELLRMPA